MITVTKSFLPPVEEYIEYIKRIFKNGILTNQGPILKELEEKLENYLGIDNLHYLSNGTVALQIALQALDITDGEIITTPFSYVATVSSILWERCTPIFVDIEPNNFTINPELIEQRITSKTKAIMPVHVFGYACDVEAIEKIANKYSLYVIYDAAHVFGTQYKGRSLLDYGDISTCSFHATKLFHTVEGGACIAKDSEISKKIDLIKRFGHQMDDHIRLGINAKNSEIHAAMGIINLKYVQKNIEERKHISYLYDGFLQNYVGRPKSQTDLIYNYSYYPVIFETEKQLLNVFSALKNENVFPRRYFYPSLNNLPYLKYAVSCHVSEDISSRIACLPLYNRLGDADVENISRIIVKAL